MKKILIIFYVMILSLLLLSCNSEKENNSKEERVKVIKAGDWILTLNKFLILMII